MDLQDSVLRYGRQMLVPGFGLEGQQKLAKARVLVVGAGGLGSPALQYLAGAGVSTLGIVDHDTVEISNLHRQTIHSTDKVRRLKAESAAEFIATLNPNVAVVVHAVQLAPSNSFSILENYDVILDCTDTPQTRYLVNDTAVLLNKPVVSASALKTSGQLTLLHFQSGPCYRCLFPQPPPPDSVLACGEAGILGPVVGLMGVMQALEAIKIIIGIYDNDYEPFMVMLNACSRSMWRTVRMRNRKASCEVCGDSATITREQIETGRLDYVVFCGKKSVKTLDRKFRVTATECASLKQDPRIVMVDVRPPEEYALFSLPGSINIPLSDLAAHLSQHSGRYAAKSVYVCCRQGNDSQVGVSMFHDAGISAKDVIGGLQQWSIEVDEAFPRF